MTITTPAQEAGPVDFDTYGTIYAPRGGTQLAPFGLGPQGTGEAYPFRRRITPEGPFAPATGRRSWSRSSASVTITTRHCPSRLGTSRRRIAPRWGSRR